MALQRLQVKDIGLFISTNTTTPDWLEVVCIEDHSLEGTNDVTRRKTRTCGDIVSVGTPSFTITASGVGNVTPTVGDEASFQELALAFNSGSDIAWKLADRTTPANYYRSGLGVITKLTETGKNGDSVGFDITIEANGAVDLVV